MGFTKHGTANIVPDDVEDGIAWDVGKVVSS
jgi:hypothetical protein